MRINVGGLAKSPVGTVGTYPIDTTVALQEGGSAWLRGEARLVRTGQGVLVSVEAEAGLPLACSRCLAVFDASLPTRFDEEFWLTVDPFRDGRLPEPEAEDTFTVDHNQVLDLTEVFRQYILMAIPMKPLCRPGCAGLCPQCGQDLNTGPCGCLQPTGAARS